MHRKLICLIFVVLVHGLTPLVFAATYPGQLGVGVGVGEAGGTFVDMAKEHHRYSRLPSGTMTYDSEGWPACDTQLIMDFRLVAEWEAFIDDPEAYRYDNRGTYKCSFTGQATLAAAGASIANKSYNSGTNTTTFDLIITQRRVYCHLNFTNTKRTAASATGTGFTELKMIRPGYPADTTQLFHTLLLDALASANFAAIRFSGFTGCNDENVTYPDTTTWSERKLPTDAAQVSMEAAGKWESGCWEYVIALANAARIDPWINIPVSADTTYVTQVATMFRDNLHPSLNVYVESSNEVWNGIFPQQAWNAAQASALGINEHENHARRTVELAQIFEAVFGAGSLNNRVRVMLCCHAPMLKWWVENYMIAYIDGTYPGSAKDYIYAVARQTYFGGASATGQAGTEGYTVTQILDECHSNITGQMSEGSPNYAGRQQWIDKAAAWQLVGGACSYEGGTDFMGTDYSDYPDSLLRNIDNRITAVRSARMKDELMYNYDDAFFALGGNLAIDLALSSSYNRWGCWGLTDDLTDPDRNYQFEAARELLGYETGDLNEDSRVNVLDVGIFCEQWLDGFEWMDQDLVSYWKFDQGSGTTAYDSVGTNHGAINGAQWTEGKSAYALSFDNAGDYVDCGNDSSLDLTNNFSISVWVNLNEQFGFILNKGNVRGLSSGGAYTLYYNSVAPGAVTFEVRNSSNNGSQWVTISPFDSTEQWTHIVGTFSDGHLSIYKDGAFVDDADLNTPTINSNTGHLGIGANGSGSLSINGKIDDVRIYNWALSPAEVAAMYGCSGAGCAELDGIFGVNWLDFAKLAENWQQ